MTVHLADSSENTGTAAEGDVYINIMGAWGSMFGDTLVGDGNANWFVGDSGNDLIDGQAGNDSLYGSDGDDTLLGGDGNDYLVAGTGNNILDGGAGADTLDGAGGWGVADYRNAQSAVTVRLNNSGSSTGDLAAGDVFVDVNGVFGSAHSDILGGNLNANWMIAGGGDDIVNGGRGNDTLYGSEGADTIDGGDDSDQLSGGDGNDVLMGNSGLDLLDGGAGFDVASYEDAGYGVIVNLATGVAAGDTLIGIEGLRGSNFDDQLTGDAGANTLSGNGGNDYLRADAGNDTLDGGAGDDNLVGGAGADALNGGAGMDVAVYATASGGVIANLANSSINTGDATGDSFIAVEGLSGSGYADQLIGNQVANVLSGAGGNDLLSGGGSADTLDGGSGLDTLVGGAGNDVLIGGSGSDAFLFDTTPDSGNVDQILDFVTTEDRIHLSQSALAGFAPSALKASAFKLGTFATAAGPQILYNKGSGELFLDVDGTGAQAAVKFAVVAAGTALTADHFLVI